MNALLPLIRAITFAAAAGGFMVSSGVFAQGANPCAPKAGNPCVAAAPEVDPALVRRPAGTKLAEGAPAALVKEGERLFMDPKLGSNGMACESCHAGNNAFMPTFAEPYPQHVVAMATAKGGVDTVHLDEMVQFCMVVPMKAKPLPWDSRELAALTAYTAERQKAFQAAQHTTGNAANPCALKAVQ